MALSGDDAKQLKAMIALAKKEPISFAVCMGSKPDGAVVLMHKNRKPEALAREAKASGETVRVACGTIEVDGTKSRLTLVDKPPSGLGKHLKAFFKSIDILLSVELLDASGQVLDDGSGSEGLTGNPEQPSAEPSAPVSEASQTTAAEDSKAWLSDWAAAEPKVVAALAKEGPDAAKLRAVRDFTLGKAEAGQFAAAQKSLATLLGLIEQAAKTQGSAETGGQADRADLIKRMAEVKARLAGIDGPMGQKLTEGFTKAVEMVRAGKLDPAADLLAKVETALDRIAASQVGSAPEKAPSSDQGAKPAEDPRMAKIGGAEAELRKQALSSTGGDVQDALTALLDRVKQALDAGEAETALAGLKRVQDALKLQAEVDRLSPLVARAASSGLVADVNALTLLFNSVAEAVPAPDTAKAMAALARVEDMIDQGAAKGTPGSDRQVSSDTRPYAEARINWSLARNRLKAEIGKLEAGIAAVLKREGLDEDVQVDGTLVGYVAKLDARLEDLLARIVSTDDTDERSTLKGQARRVVGEYRAELDTDFFRDVDAANGFLNVAVASTARAALQDLDKVLGD